MTSTVSWRKTISAIALTVTAILAITVVVRSDGLPAVDAASARATRWFVHQPTGRVVLVDGYGGRALAGLDAGVPGDRISVAEGGAGAYILNDTSAEARSIDSAELSLGTPFGLTTLGDGLAISAVGQAGLVVVDPGDDEATLVPTDGAPIGFAVDTGTNALIAPDGSIWSIVGPQLRRTTSSAVTSESLGVDGAILTLVGNEPLVVDREGRRARLGTGSWQPLSTDADPSEIVAQTQGPGAGCGWVGADADLWCVSSDGIDESSTVAGLDIDGGDILAIAGDAAAVVTRGPSSIVRLDWRAGRILDEQPTSVPSDANLHVTSTTDLVWVDDTSGNIVWAINPWKLEAIDKAAQGILVIDEGGDIIDAGESGASDVGGADDAAATALEIREPDDNGIDDPPVAVDDRVTARSGASVPVQVTGNDYDPDGEAIAVVAVGVPGYGQVDIGTASTVVYTPDAGFVGTDEFDYTIADGNGTTATATVRVELLPTDATNKPPVGVDDTAETGAGVPVIVEVLLNDVDPERDALGIGGFSPPGGVGQASLGEVTETVGDSGLPALRFAPAEGFEGTAIFSYRPVDSLDSVGDDVEVRVEVARIDEQNRPPITRPDAVRLRRNVVTPVLVLLNDTDPDGDTLDLSVVEPLPEGLEVGVEGAQLSIVARAGAPTLTPFEYEIDDGRGHTVRGSVLVNVIDDVEPNRPPVVTADSDKVVAGETVIVDVVSNDTDPDGDPLTVIEVSQPEQSQGQVVVFNREKIQFTAPVLADDTEQVNARFTYTVSDGNGHEVAGDVTITVLPEALQAPPFARDDSTFTFIDVPVTIDVLRNDGDPSGGRPSLAGRIGCPSGGSATVTTDNQVRFDPPPGQSGAFRCTYEVTNDRGLRASASIIVSVREPQLSNDPPIANNDSLSVEVGSVGSVDVTLNDTDPDGDRTKLQVVSSTAPSIGTAQRSNNTITFTAGAVTGTTTINYQVSDEDGAVSLGRLLIRITERVNQPPIAVADTKSIFGPGTPQQFSVLANDSDPDETPGALSVVSAARVSGDATVSLAGTTVTISPNPNFVGDAVATYTMRDGAGLTATSTVTLRVEPPLNRPPDARDDAGDVINGGTTRVAVLLNDVDPDGDNLILSIISAPDPQLGNATVNPDRSISFTANPGAAGTAIIGYQITDGEVTDNAVLRITVRPCTESAPSAPNAFLRTGYRQPITVDPSAYGSNGNIVDVEGPAGYTNGVYSPPADENGNVTITYAVVNSCRQRAAGTITIDVNQEPVGQPRSIEMTRGTVREIPVSDLATDLEALVISGAPGAPAWVGVEAGRLVLAPSTDIAPTTSAFTVTVRDPGGLATGVDVTVVIGNAPPVAVADVIDVSDGNATTVSLVDNDTDGDGPNAPLRIRAVEGTISFPEGGSGTISISDNRRSVTVTPPPDAAGVATFTYTVEDGDGAVSAPVTVTVNGPRLNTVPFANDQTVVAVIGEPTPFTLTAGDGDGDPITVIDLDVPDGWVVQPTGGLNYTVTASGSGTFTYRVTDDIADSRMATVTVDATPPATTTTTTTTTTVP